MEAAWARWFDPSHATLIVGGDVSGVDVEQIARDDDVTFKTFARV